VPDDRLAAATAELYEAAPEAFTGRRAELAAAARDAGDRGAAKAITALRRPTRAAWVVNRLARADPGAPGKLAELAAALRAAQEARHGPRLRELSAARGALVDALTAQALAAAGVAGPPPSLRLEVSQTLTAALADPETAAAFATGTLTRAVQWSGFGVLPAAEPGDDDDAEAAQAPPARAAVPAPRAAERPAETAPQVAGRRAGPARPDDGAPRTDLDVLGATDAAGPSARRRRADQGSERPGAGPRRAGLADGGGAGRRARAGAGQADAAADAAAAAAARRQAEASEWLAREAAERAARQREQYEDAERMVATAASLAAEADAAEERLEVEVRDLEQRLTKARSDLAAARMRARHAEAAERRARQAFDRLAPG
jgi:hypothetical protein